jgi:hypothetical protein
MALALVLTTRHGADGGPRLRVPSPRRRQPSRQPVPEQAEQAEQVSAG